MMKPFLDRLQHAHAKTAAGLRLQSRADLIPHPDTLVDLIFTKSLQKYSSKVLYMLSTTEDLDDVDLTFNKVCELYGKAAKQKNRVLPSTLLEAVQAKKPKQPADKKDQKPADKKTPADKQKEKFPFPDKPREPDSKFLPNPLSCRCIQQNAQRMARCEEVLKLW